MRIYLAAAVLVALALPALAAAKGPVGASISGPGLERALSVRGDGEGPGTALGNLTMASGFFAQTFGQTPDPTLRTRPAKHARRRAIGSCTPCPGRTGPTAGSSSSSTRTRSPLPSPT